VASLMFPDNTVLINFAIINRMELLEKLANGNGQWCATVAGECAESAGYPGLAALSAAEDIFGEPLYPNAHRKEWIDADTLWGYVQTLRVNDRGTPRGVQDRAAFDKWLPT
jgi:hypothetical protein